MLIANGVPSLKSDLGPLDQVADRGNSRANSTVLQLLAGCRPVRRPRGGRASGRGRPGCRDVARLPQQQREVGNDERHAKGTARTRRCAPPPGSPRRSRRAARGSRASTVAISTPREMRAAQAMGRRQQEVHGDEAQANSAEAAPAQPQPTETDEERQPAPARVARSRSPRARRRAPAPGEYRRSTDGGRCGPLRSTPAGWATPARGGPCPPRTPFQYFQRR